jgi:hypothetical protein
MGWLDLGKVRARDGEPGLNGVSPRVTVVEDTEDGYILQITDAADVFITPSLKGADGKNGNDYLGDGIAPVEEAQAEGHEAGQSPYYLYVGGGGAALIQALMIEGEMAYSVVKQLSQNPYAPPEVEDLEASYEDGVTTVTWDVVSSYLHHFELSGLSGTVVAGPTETRHTFTAPEGVSLLFRAVDIAGKAVEREIPVSGVPAPPAVSSLSAKRMHNESVVTVAWVVASAYVDALELTIGGTAHTLPAEQTSYSADIPNGTLVSLRAVDVFAQAGSRSAAVVYYPEPPVINSFTAVNPGGGMANLTWSVTSSYIERIELAWSDQAVSFSAGTTSYSASIPSGVSVTLRAVDSYGQQAEQTVTVA